MQPFQKEFIEFAIENEALRFGEFTLKSGRISPYFYNSGLFNNGHSLALLGRFYMHAIEHAGIGFDMLFGPAYKSIPLITAIAIAYASDKKRTLPWCFNRKEEKDHGEGGTLLGAPMQGEVLIVDDVITAGTSVSLSMDLIEHNKAKAAAVVIALDRQERGQGHISATDDVKNRYGLSVFSIITLSHLVEFFQGKPEFSTALDAVRAYQQQYGANMPTVISGDNAGYNG